MDKRRFIEIMQPAFGYFNRAVTTETLELYFKELGGYTEAQLERAVEAHIAGSRFFPKIADLRKRVTGHEDQSEDKPRYRVHDDPEFQRHHMLTERIFDWRMGFWDQPTEFDRPFLYPLEPVADIGRRVYESALADGKSDRSARSYAYGTIYRESIKSFLAVNSRALVVRAS